MLEFSIPMLNLICVYTGQHFAEVSYSKKTAVAAMIWTYKCEDTQYSEFVIYKCCFLSAAWCISQMTLTLFHFKCYVSLVKINERNLVIF